MHNAKIDSSLSIMNSTFEDSIDGTGLEVSRNLSMLRGTFNGAVRLSDAKIGGNVDMEKAAFEKIKAQQKDLLEKIKKLNLKVGDKVLFGKYAGDEVEMGQGSNKVEYKFLKDEDVLGIVEK